MEIEEGGVFRVRLGEVILEIRIKFCFFFLWGGLGVGEEEKEGFCV